MPQIYSRQQLVNRGLLKVKSVAHDLGVMPTGDRRLIHSWVDAIVEHQATQKIETVEAVIDFDGDRYVVIVGGKVVHRTATYPQAERHCKWHGYTLVDNQTLVEVELEQATARAEKAKSVEDIFMGRGSGRIEQPIEDMGITIEDSNFVHDFGQSYTARIHNILAGYIWLNDDHGWTLNGREYQDDWRPVARSLVKLTRHELVA
jgi:hypothetical protein